MLKQKQIEKIKEKTKNLVIFYWSRYLSPLDGIHIPEWYKRDTRYFTGTPSIVNTTYRYPLLNKVRTHDAHGIDVPCPPNLTTYIVRPRAFDCTRLSTAASACSDFVRLPPTRVPVYLELVMILVTFLPCIPATATIVLFFTK